MRDKTSSIAAALFGLLIAFLLAGCGAGNKEGSVAETDAVPAKVGSAQCINTCHVVTPDHITGLVISTTWAASTHYLDNTVGCEDCHGGGGNHWGVGPIPYPNPVTTCASCHSLSGFVDTAHYNNNQTPDGSFSQISTSAGSTGRHIEECSRCHNPSQQFIYDRSGNLEKPSLTSLPVPRVGCSGCHNGHDPSDNTTTVKQRNNAKLYFPRFRNYVVDNTTGAQSDNASGNAIDLTSLNLIFQPNGAVKSNGVLNASSVVGTNNEIHPERLCASCHTRGTYKYSGGTTHQSDVHTEWKQSGHGDRNAAAFAEFSANPPAYTMDNGSAYPVGTHQASYPYDMALSSSSTAGPADNTRNAGRNNYACFKCHHGIGSIAHQDNVEGTSAAPVLFGDATVTCITCHDPHTDVTGNTKNTRKPVLMSKYTSASPAFSISGNVFLDNTAVPSSLGNETICIFCHQGRESGLTLFKIRIASGTTVTGSFLNPHYLGAGAMLWARNGYEYTDNSTGTPVAKQYGYVSAHQQTNCNGCHMASSATAGLGGHTWKIIADDDSVVNSATCNAASCHNGRVPITNSGGQFDSFYDNVVATVKDYDRNGVVEGIAVEIAGLENLLIALLDNNGITYSDINYPYFFQKGVSPATAYTAWTRAQLRAAFNIQYVIKGLPAGATSQVGQPNTTAAVHNYRYIIQLLMDSYENLYNSMGTPPAGFVTPATLLANRPSGARATTNYNPQVGGGYDPLQ